MKDAFKKRLAIEWLLFLKVFLITWGIYFVVAILGATLKNQIILEIYDEIWSDIFDNNSLSAIMIISGVPYLIVQIIRSAIWAKRNK